MYLSIPLHPEAFLLQAAAPLNADSAAMKNGPVEEPQGKRHFSFLLFFLFPDPVVPLKSVQAAAILPFLF